MKKWVNLIWGILGFLMFLTGLYSQNVVTMVVGLSLAFGHVSSYLTTHVRSDNIMKKAIEFITIFAAFGIFGYGYIVTQSLLLGLMIIFIAGMSLIVFTATYLLSKLRNKPKNIN